MQKKPYFHTTAAVKKTRTISINAFNNCNTHYNDKFLDTVKLLPKSVIGLQKINKTNRKHFGGQILGIDLFLNISNLSIPLHFIYAKIRITNLDGRTLLCI